MIRITTQYDVTTLRAFYRHHHTRLVWVFILVLIANVGGVYNAIDLAGTGQGFAGSLVVMVLLDILCIANYFVYPLFRVRSLSSNGYVLTLELDEDEIRYSLDKAGSNDSGRYEYASLLKAERDKNSYYIYLSRRKAVIASRAGIENATEAELEKFLTKKLGRSKIKFSIQE